MFMLASRLANTLVSWWTAALLAARQTQASTGQQDMTRHTPHRSDQGDYEPE
jgi:hypothetical protein